MSKLKKQFRRTHSDSFPPEETDIPIGYKIIGVNHTHVDVKVRPFVVWAAYKDMDFLKPNAFEALQIGTVKSRDYYSNNLYFQTENKLEHSRDLGLQSRFISMTTPNIIANDLRSVKKIYPSDQSILPDLILRRTDALLNSPISDLRLDTLSGPRPGTRHGFVLETIRQDEVRSGNLAPDVADAAIAREPSEIKGFITQKDINRISLIARHYSRYCIENHMPVVWPSPGSYPDWPEEFTMFEKPQPSDRKLPMLWRKKQTSTPQSFIMPEFHAL